VIKKRVVQYVRSILISPYFQSRLRAHVLLSQNDRRAGGTPAGAGGGRLPGPVGLARGSGHESGGHCPAKHSQLWQAGFHGITRLTGPL